MTGPDDQRDEGNQPSPVPRSDEATESEGLGEGSGDERARELADPARERSISWRVPRARTIIASVVVAALVAATVTFGLLWQSQSRAEAERAAVLDFAESFAVEFTTYHYEELEENFDRVTNSVTDRYAEVYQEAHEPLAEALEENQADSDGEVLHVGIAEFSGERAVVLAFVDQTITNVNTPQPKIDRNRMVFTIVDADGDWKVDEVELR